MGSHEEMHQQKKMEEWQKITETREKEVFIVFILWSSLQEVRLSPPSLGSTDCKLPFPTSITKLMSSRSSFDYIVFVCLCFCCMYEWRKLKRIDCGGCRKSWNSLKQWVNPPAFARSKPEKRIVLTSFSLSFDLTKRVLNFVI